jgi:hypothetical protein
MPPTIDFRILEECGLELVRFLDQYGPDGLAGLGTRIDGLQRADVDSVRVDDMAYGLRLAEHLATDNLPYVLLYLVVEQPPLSIWILVQVASQDIETFQSQFLMSAETIGRVNKAISLVVNSCLSLTEPM